MKCIVCGIYYKQNMFNSSMECEDCISIESKNSDIDPETEIDVSILKNPSGRTKPMLDEEFEYKLL